MLRKLKRNCNNTRSKLKHEQTSSCDCDQNKYLYLLWRPLNIVADLIFRFHFSCRYENWRGFYKGLGTNLIRVTPATMITFVTYEHVSHYMIEKSKIE